MLNYKNLRDHLEDQQLSLINAFDCNLLIEFRKWQSRMGSNALKIKGIGNKGLNRSNGGMSGGEDKAQSSKKLYMAFSHGGC